MTSFSTTGFLLEKIAKIETQATQADYTFGPGLFTHPHHTDTVQGAITRNLVAKFDEIRDEIVDSFNEYIPLTKGSI